MSWLYVRIFLFLYFNELNLIFILICKLISSIKCDICIFFNLMNVIYNLN